jgi:hypothetical protein
MVLKLVYTLFLALLVALFVGLGIDAFYPGPVSPNYPSELGVQKPDCADYEQLKATQEEFDQSQKDFNEKSKAYNRNVSIVSLAAAIAILIASLTLLQKIKMIADGILLGGVFTTAYSIIRGLMSEDSRFRFLVVTAGLVIALVLGYVKFLRPKEAEETH